MKPELASVNSLRIQLRWPSNGFLVNYAQLSTGVNSTCPDAKTVAARRMEWRAFSQAIYGGKKVLNVSYFHLVSSQIHGENLLARMSPSLLL